MIEYPFKWKYLSAITGMCRLFSDKSPPRSLRPLHREQLMDRTPGVALPAPGAPASRHVLSIDQFSAARMQRLFELAYALMVLSYHRVPLDSVAKGLFRVS
jgi:hypothetical protein